MSTAQYIEWALVCAVCVAVLHASITDVQSGLIRNGCSYGLLSVGLLGQVALLVLDEMTLTQVAMRVLGGLGVAALLYRRGIWAPGDAKLYLAVVTAMPGGILPVRSLLSVDGSLGAVLLNSFALGFLMSVVQALRHGGDAQGSWDVRYLFERAGRQLAMVAAAAGGVQVMLEMGLHQQISFGELLLIALLGAIGLQGPSVSPLKWVPASVVAVRGCYVAVVSGGITAHALAVGVVWVIMVGYELLLMQKVTGFRREVDVEALSPGLVPYLTVWERGGEGEVLCAAGTALSAAQVARLQRRARSGGLGPEGQRLEILSTMPFAPLIAAGTFLTVLLGGTPAGLLQGLLLGTAQ